MAELHWTPPLAPQNGQTRRFSSPELEIVPLAQLNLIWVQLAEPNDPVLDGVADVLGFPLPLSPNTSTGQGGRGPGALWIAPGEWMLIADGGKVDELAARVSESLGGDLASATDMSESRAGFLISGPKATDLLSEGCGLDLHPDTFAPGSCTSTRFAGISALLYRTHEAESYRLYVDRSCAEYIWNWLGKAAEGPSMA